jgi:signal transduction histidine kinase
MKLEHAEVKDSVEDVARAALIREQDARREAEAANRTKNEFLALLSHEL